MISIDQSYKVTVWRSMKNSHALMILFWVPIHNIAMFCAILAKGVKHMIVAKSILVVFVVPESLVGLRMKLEGLVWTH